MSTWVKLYHSMLNERDIAQLDDSAYRRLIEYILKAGKNYNGGGFVAEYDPEDDADTATEKLIDAGLVLCSGGRLYVSHLFRKVFEYGPRNFLNHEELLKSAYWQHFRTQVFIRDDWQCVRCGLGPPEVVLHCHHLNYDHWGFEALSDCQTLCHICHAKHHNYPIVTELEPGTFAQALPEDWR